MCAGSGTTTPSTSTTGQTNIPSYLQPNTQSLANRSGSLGSGPTTGTGNQMGSAPQGGKPGAPGGQTAQMQNQGGLGQGGQGQGGKPGAPGGQNSSMQNDIYNNRQQNQNNYNANADRANMFAHGNYNADRADMTSGILHGNSPSALGAPNTTGQTGGLTGGIGSLANPSAASVAGGQSTPPKYTTDTYTQ